MGSLELSLGHQEMDDHDEAQRQQALNEIGIYSAEIQLAENPDKDEIAHFLESFNQIIDLSKLSSVQRSAVEFALVTIEKYLNS